MGQAYPLRAEPPVDQTLIATLVAIDPVLDSGTQTFRCVFEIDNDQLSLPAGFLVYPSSEMISGQLGVLEAP